MRRAGERGEDLLAVDAPAPVDTRRRGAEGRAPGGRRASLGEGLGVDGAFIDYLFEMNRTMGVVLGTLRRRHVQIVRQRARPEGGAGVHVEGEGGSPAVLAQRRGHERIGLEVGPAAAEFLRHAQAEEARRAQLGVVFVRKARFVVVAGGAFGEAGAERLCLADQIPLPGGKRIAGPHDRIVRLAHILCRLRKLSSTPLNASGCSIGPRWPQPLRTTNSAPEISFAMRCITSGGAVLSSLPATSSAGAEMFFRFFLPSKVVRR